MGEGRVSLFCKKKFVFAFSTYYIFYTFVKRLWKKQVDVRSFVRMDGGRIFLPRSPNPTGD
jgi:hypothetical protein